MVSSFSLAGFDHQKYHTKGQQKHKAIITKCAIELPATVEDDEERHLNCTHKTDA